MIFFVLDACAAARRYFPDIGTANIDRIFDYPDSLLVLPNIARAEIVSAIIAAYNATLIDEQKLNLAMSKFAIDHQMEKYQIIRVNDAHIDKGIRLLRKHKMVPHGTHGTGKAGIGGADSIILSVGVELTKLVNRSVERVIFITSDWALYSSAKEERNLEVFHFWTCECRNCGHVRIPKKGRKELCPNCGKVCLICQLSVCDSRYAVRF